MKTLNSTILELRKAIEKEEKALTVRKEGLVLLEKASGKLTSGSKVAPAVRKYKTRASKKDQPLNVAPSAVPEEKAPAAKPKPSWTPERRAKTLASLKKTRAAKKKAAK